VKSLVLIYQNPQDTDRSNSSKLVDALADKHDSGLIENISGDSMALKSGSVPDMPMTSRSKATR
jgi:hypothetical protein